VKPRARLLPCRSRTTTLADCGYEGAGTGIHVPVKNPGGNQELAIGDRARNRLLRGLRFQGERGFALLTRCWTVLQHTTASPRNITQIARAALVLTNSGTTTSRELSEISDTRALLSSRVGVRNEGCAGRCGFR